MSDITIHKTAIVSPGAELSPGVEIGAYSIIGDEVRIGQDTTVGPHVVINGPCEIGQRCRFFQFASIGEIPQDLKYHGERSEVIIGDGNIFREFVTVNRGTEGGGLRTVVGNNNLLMAYAHVAHDCILGSNIVLANSANLAGHIKIDDHAIVGGLVGVHQFVHIGAFAMIGGVSGVSKDIPPYTIAAGHRSTLRGLNLTGLERHRFPDEVISQLKHAYRFLFRSGFTLQTALQKIQEAALTSAEVKHMIDFVKNSKRGVARE